MVVGGIADIRTMTDDRVDRVLRALADATRRDIVRRAVRGDESVSALARRYPMTVTAVQKHVAVLERAGLVTKERRGREQLVQSSQDAITLAMGLLSQLETLWVERIDKIEDIIKEEDEGGREWRS